MTWQVCDSDAHPAGFPFAIVESETVIAWWKHEDDARAVAEAREAAPEIVDLAESGLDWIDEARRRRIRALVTRVGDKLPEWRCLRAGTHPDGFPLAITQGAERIAWVSSGPVAAFVVEASGNVPELSAITRAAATRNDEQWSPQDVAVVKTLALRLKRRLAALDALAAGREEP